MIEVKKYAHFVSATITGTDEQGRTLVICPQCHDEAYIREDGKLVCPTSEAQDAFLARAMELLDDQLRRSAGGT